MEHDYWWEMAFLINRPTKQTRQIEPLKKKKNLDQPLTVSLWVKSHTKYTI